MRANETIRNGRVATGVWDVGVPCASFKGERLEDGRWYDWAGEDLFTLYVDDDGWATILTGNPSFGGESLTGIPWSVLKALVDHQAEALRDEAVKHPE